MEIWFLILLTISISALLRALLNFFSPAAYTLPPGPRIVPVIGNIMWMKKSLMEIERIIHSLHRELGPIITLRIGSRPSIFIADHSLAHQALVENGAVFSNRPSPSATTKISTSNQHTISSSFYGPTWRLLRRNLTSEILHPSRVKSYSHARKWVLQILLDRFQSQSNNSGGAVTVVDNFQYAMFCLLVLMCLGDKLDEEQIKEIERVQRAAIIGSRRFELLNYWPALTKILLKKRWLEFLKLQEERQQVMIPLIKARKKAIEQRMRPNDEEFTLSYVDTLLNLQLPGEKRKLTDMEIQSLCNEFLNGGTDTTSTALQWIMANLVKCPKIQEKLYMEIKEAVNGGDSSEIKEEELHKMPYLKAIILEGLRRHPPAHFVLPHTVTEDVILGNFLVPKKASVNFMVAEMGWDGKVWEDPMEFKPERFMDKEFDITGSREIKMMPFGVGRRICPGYGLAMLHLEYFVANLIWNYEWKAVNDDVDLSEKLEFTVVMKNPLQAKIFPRFK